MPFFLCTCDSFVLSFTQHFVALLCPCAMRTISSIFIIRAFVYSFFSFISSFYFGINDGILAISLVISFLGAFCRNCFMTAQKSIWCNRSISFYLITIIKPFSFSSVLAFTIKIQNREKTTNRAFFFFVIVNDLISHLANKIHFLCVFFSSYAHLPKKWSHKKKCWPKKMNSKTNNGRKPHK